MAITPDGVREVGQYGVQVLLEAGAGADSSFPDEAYQRAGAEIVDAAEEVWERAGLICKVKEPQPSEFDWFRPDLTIFTYLHLAAYPGVADALLDHGVTGIAYETVDRRRRRAAAAGPDERGGGAHVGADRRPLPRAPQRRAWRAARRRARRAPGAGRGARRRQRRMERGVDGGRPRGRGRPARPQRRPAALHRPDPDGPHHHAHLEPRTGRAGGGRGRPGDRCRAGARRAGPGRGHRGDDR